MNAFSLFKTLLALAVYAQKVMVEVHIQWHTRFEVSIYFWLHRDTVMRIALSDDLLLTSYNYHGQEGNDKEHLSG